MKPQVNIDTITFIRMLNEEGIMGNDIAELLGLSKQTVSVYLNFDSSREYEELMATKRGYRSRSNYMRHCYQTRKLEKHLRKHPQLEFKF